MDKLLFSQLYSALETAIDPKVFGVSGSPRKNGNSDVLLKTILAGAAEVNITTTSVRLPDISLQGCIGCEQCRKDKICTGLMDGMSLLYQSIISSQALVLVSPTHNYNVTSWMKAFIDRLYCFYDFANTRPRSWSSRLGQQNRKAVVAAICEQEDERDMGFTIEAMTTALDALGYEIVDTLPVFRIFDKGKVKEDTASLEKAHALGKKLGLAISPDSNK